MNDMGSIWEIARDEWAGHGICIMGLRSLSVFFKPLENHRGTQEGQNIVRFLIQKAVPGDKVQEGLGQFSQKWRFFKHTLYKCQREGIQARTEVEAMGMEKRIFQNLISIGAGDWWGVGLRACRVPPRSLGVALDAEEHGTTCWWVLIYIMDQVNNQSNTQTSLDSSQQQLTGSEGWLCARHWSYYIPCVQNKSVQNPD